MLLRLLRMEPHLPGIPNIQEAINFAVSVHAGSLREGADPLPYITHPFEVLNNLRIIGKVTDLDMWCAAILHDTVESEATSVAQIESRFGPRVASLVSELTRREPAADQIAGLGKKQIWKMRAQMLIDEIARMSPDAQQIKLADRLANLSEANRSKKGDKLERYLWQTNEILKVVPKDVNRDLWDAIATMSKSSKKEDE